MIVHAGYVTNLLCGISISISCLRFCSLVFPREQSAFWSSKTWCRHIAYFRLKYTLSMHIAPIAWSKSERIHIDHENPPVLGRPGRALRYRALPKTSDLTSSIYYKTYHHAWSSSSTTCPAPSPKLRSPPSVSICVFYFSQTRPEDHAWVSTLITEPLYRRRAMEGQHEPIVRDLMLQ